MTIANTIPLEQFRLNTNDFAKRQFVSPNTIRREFCMTGSWKGVKPIKTPGGRLIWPDISAAELAQAVQ